MPDYFFNIIDNKNKKNNVEPDKRSEDDLIKDLLENFAKDRNKKLEDYAFYYKGSLIKIDEKLKIKDSIFAQYEGKSINIIAMLLTGPISSPTEEEGKEPQKGQDKNEIQNEPQKNKENEVKDQSEEEPVRRKRINKMYYNDIICPKCKTSAIIEKNEGELNFKILNCENFHYLNNIKYDMLDEFVFDLDDISEDNIAKLSSNKYKDILVCDLCHKHKQGLTPPEDQMYVCSCGSTVCSEDYGSHNDKGHFKTKVDDKNYYCLKHGKKPEGKNGETLKENPDENQGKKFSSYCFDCNANLCEECEKEHEGHETEKFLKIKPKREEVRELENKVDDQKEKLLDFIETTRKLFDDIINTVESYLNSYIMIEKGLIRRFNRQELNYQLIRNLKNKKLFENDIFQKLENLDKIEEINKRFISLFNDIYKPINDAKQKKEKKDKKNQTQIIPIPNNSMKITYNIGKEKVDRRIKLFDPVFVENNKDKLSLEIEGEIRSNQNNEKKQKKQEKQKELCVYVENYINLTVTLSQIENKPPITDMSYMFNNCKYLTDVNFKNWKTDNITSMEAMFQLCNLKKIPDISNFNTNNLENIRAMFCKCTQITEIPNMNKWFNTNKSKLRNMSMLFNGCISLLGCETDKNKINLSKNWYTTNLEDMSYMFNRCKKVKEIHNLKSIQTLNVKNMCGLFNGCENLSFVTIDFKTPNVEDMSIMFQGCKKLEKMKNTFSDTSKLEDISGMFSDCIALPNIATGIANTVNVTNMTGLFKNCYKLEVMPDLSKWNMMKVEKYKGMFYGCQNKKLAQPKWMPTLRFKKGTNYDKILENSKLDNQDLKNSWKNNEPKDEIN